MLRRPVPPKIPIGIDDFRRLRTGGYLYVDKSAFVRECLESSATALFLPRPRRFGKTLGLSMLRCFLDRSAGDARSLFDGLELSRDGEAVWSHANRYPVIALTFKDARSATWDMTHALLRDQIVGLFEEHRAALDGGKLTSLQQALFRRMLGGAGTPSDYALSLLHLSAALHAHHGEEVVVLVDEYDAPIHAAYLGGYSGEALDFFRVFLGAGLKENSHVRKGILTGVLRFARESIFSGLNNLDVHTLLSGAFRSAFGFTEPEVVSLLSETGCPTSLDIVRRWYDGYLFGGQVTYNPWSVLSFVHRGGAPAPYWLNTSSNDLVRDLLEKQAHAVQPQIDALLAGGSIRKRLEESIALGDLETDPGALWSLLVFSGYLKAQIVPAPPGERAAYDLSIPNLEVREVYLQTFLGWMRKALRRRGASLEALLAALVAGDAARFQAQLGAFSKEVVSSHDVGGPEPERFYHGLMIGLTAALGDDFEIRSNRGAGSGRADMLLRPRRAGAPGIVLELKTARAPAGWRRAMSAGMRQIHEMGYPAELQAVGVDHVLCVVVAFDGKDVRVAIERVPGVAVFGQEGEAVGSAPRSSAGAPTGAAARKRVVAKKKATSAKGAGRKPRRD